MISIATKDETLSKLQRSSDEKERALRAQLSNSESTSRQRVIELTTHIDKLQSELTQRTIETENLKEALSVATKADEQNKVLV